MTYLYNDNDNYFCYQYNLASSMVPINIKVQLS